MQEPDGASLLSSQKDTTVPFETESADDFMGDGQLLLAIGWWGGYWGGSPVPPDAFRIRIYAKATDDCPGELLYDETIGDYHETLLGTSGEYCVNLGDPFLKADGVNYSLSIQAILNFPPQWGWATGTGNGKQGCFRSDYFSYSDWVPWGDVLEPYEHAFVLFNGTDEGWLKMDPPPDVDKSAHGHINMGTCWLATAANMLAGAGYGNGATVQLRADGIYTQLVAKFGLGGGWTDQAIQWWLGSIHNTWPNNPYTVVTVYGNKSPKNPWANANGARFIGNELRRCQFVGVSISWPVAGAQIGTDGHAITGWGDDGDNNPLQNNPSQLKVTDSDRDTGGNVQT